MARPRHALLATAGPGPLRRLSWALAFMLLAAGNAACTSLPPPPTHRPITRALGDPSDTPLARLATARRTQAGARSDSGFALLGSVDAAFTSRLALIDQARRTLDLQYYAVHADASTAVLVEGLRAAAARGVRVRLLLDDFNSTGADAQVLRLAFVPGIEVRLFNPVPGTRGSFIERIVGSLGDVASLHKRMHNKLFIADNAWGITGGRNLGDAYFGGGSDNTFIDLDVLAAGRIVRDMSASFDRYWNDPSAYPAPSLMSRADLDRLRERTLPPPAGTPVPAANRPPMDLARVDLAWAPAALLVDQPGKLDAGDGDDADDPGATVIDGLLGLMGRARNEVLVVSPYFVPGRRMMDTFADLRRRGVRVRVLTNSLASNDAPAAHAGYARHRPKLLDLGIELHEMRADPRLAGASRSGVGIGGSMGSGAGGSKGGASRASLHAKAVIIDRRLAVIGSMNLDLRSQLHNSEVALVVRSPVLAQAAASAIERTLAVGAYRLERDGRGLAWRAPPGAAFGDAHREPEAPLRLQLLVDLLGPLAPDEML